MVITGPTVSKRLTRHEAELLINHLSSALKVPKPNLKWGKHRRGKYTPRTETIHVGPNSWRGIHSVIHEFAHHVDMTRREWKKNFMDIHDFHGMPYRWALLDCVHCVFTNSTFYSWDTEYRTIRKWRKKWFDS